MSQPQLFQTKYWQVLLPDGWVAINNFAEMVTLYSPNGVGMLQLFAPDKDYDSAGVGEVFRGKLIGKYYAGQIYDGTYWRSWHLSCMGRHLSVRYNCAAKNAELELSQVDEILQSIEERAAGAA